LFLLPISFVSCGGNQNAIINAWNEAIKRSSAANKELLAAANDYTATKAKHKAVVGKMTAQDKEDYNTADRKAQANLVDAASDRNLSSQAITVGSVALRLARTALTPAAAAPYYNQVSTCTTQINTAVTNEIASIAAANEQIAKMKMILGKY